MRPQSLMNFAPRCVRISPGVNSRAELVTLAPGLRQRCFPLDHFARRRRHLKYCHFILTLFILKDVDDLYFKLELEHCFFNAKFL